MHNFAYPLVAIRANGETIIAATPDEAVAFNRLRPGAHHRQQHLYIACIGHDGPVWRESAVTTSEWIVRDDEGRIVLHEDLPATNLPRSSWLRRQLAAAQDAAARGLPIPGTGRGYRYSNGYRGFRQNASMRAAEAGLADDLAEWGLEGLNVGRRRAHLLPHMWDDVPYRWGRNGGWKKHRSTQWR